MACVSGEGTIEIDLAEFFAWVAKQHEPMGEVAYGVPRVNNANKTLELDYACASDGSPHDWAQKPKAVTQWDGVK